MSAKKQRNIQDFFSRKLSSASSPTPSPSAKIKEKTENKGDDGSTKKLDQTTEEEMDELTQLCVDDDDDMDVVEPIVEKKKRKRIIMESSDEDDEANTPVKKKKTLGETNRSYDSSTPKSTNKQVTPRATKQGDKENSTPPSSAKKLKDKLSLFATPTVKDSKALDEDTKTNGDQMETISFPHLKHEFLDPKKIKDKMKHRPDHPDYNPGTLYVPDSFLKEQTPAQRQWWEFKQDHYDKVLFFKMGKFYELFNMDAVLAVERCGLIYMKSKVIAHCGFPEAAFERYAEVLVDSGYQVVRIEQTETPADMEVRCKKISRPTKFDKVVRREICRVQSKGTMTNGGGGDSAYLTSFTASKSLEDDSQILVGLCFLDASVGVVNLCQFSDDKDLSCLETLLAFYPPTEIIQDRSSKSLDLTSLTSKFSFVPKRIINFPQATKTLKMLHDYYGDKSDWPAELCKHLDDTDSLGLTPLKDSELALSAFGAVINFLSEALIDNLVMEQKQIKTISPPLERISIAAGDQNGNPMGSRMVLDNKTLQHLDILPNPDHPDVTSLFKVIDKTMTPMGKRLLRQWLCMPLLQLKDIQERQDFIKFFENHPEVIGTLQENLKGIPDLEKLCSSIYASGIKLPSDHPEQRAIYYEQVTYAAKKVGKLLQALDTLEKLQSLFLEKLDVNEDCTFHRLISKQFPDIRSILKFFEDAFNHSDAVKSGKIIPKKGVDEDFDQVVEDKLELENELDAYLRGQKKKFGTSDIKYFGSGNNMYQIEVPESCCRKVNSDYTLSSQRKGFKRFTTDETKDFLARHTQAEEREAEVLSEVNRKIFLKFSSHKKIWDQVIHLASETDALMSIYLYSSNLGDGSCYPEFVCAGENPTLSFKQGKHPVVISANPDLAFIPTDFHLDEKLAILTGANMGGKSTLMRETALLTILAQIGARVPALEFRLSPVDRIFTRIGAYDNEKESTFFVELNETRVVLRYATKHSLILIDELGRGTTTYDGCAIAHAVAKSLCHRGSRTLFSTHYFELMKEFTEREDMQVYHMGVMEEEEDVVFMYTVTPGPCSKSHGFNAAKMAGLPEGIIANGIRVAESFEKENANLFQLSQILQ